jgi:hypothetical protein
MRLWLRETIKWLGSDFTSFLWIRLSHDLPFNYDSFSEVINIVDYEKDRCTSTERVPHGMIKTNKKLLRFVQGRRQDILLYYYILDL